MTSKLGFVHRRGALSQVALVFLSGFEKNRAKLVSKAAELREIVDLSAGAVSLSF